MRRAAITFLTLLLGVSKAGLGDPVDLSGGRRPDRAAIEKRLVELEKEKRDAEADREAANALIAEARRKHNSKAEGVAGEALAIAEDTIARIERAIDQLQAQLKDLDTLSRPVPDLARDPAAAKLSALRLSQVEGRIARLQKALELLGRENPQWEREWQRLCGEARESSREMMWASLDILTINLAEGARFAADRHVELAEDLVRHGLWNELQLQEERLRTMATATDGAAAKALNETVAAMHRLEQARRMHDYAEAAALVREVIANYGELRQHLNEAVHGVHDPNLSEALYDGGCALGEVGILFVRGIGQEVAPAATLTARGVEVALIYQRMHEEDKQFAALSDRAYERQQKKLELHRKLEELESERETLRHAVERARGVRP